MDQSRFAASSQELEMHRWGRTEDSWNSVSPNFVSLAYARVTEDDHTASEFVLASLHLSRRTLILILILRFPASLFPEFGSRQPGGKFDILVLRPIGFCMMAGSLLLLIFSVAISPPLVVYIRNPEFPC